MTSKRRGEYGSIFRGYTVDGRIKQVLLSPREIDVRQLPADARQSWVNPHLVYTHGYGVVLGEVNKTTPKGTPDRPVNPLQLAMASGATFVARAFSGKPKELADLIVQGIDHKGFSERVAEICTAAARLARDVVKDRAYVAGSIGPSGLLPKDLIRTVNATTSASSSRASSATRPGTVSNQDRNAC